MTTHSIKSIYDVAPGERCYFEGTGDIDSANPVDPIARRLFCKKHGHEWSRNEYFTYTPTSKMILAGGQAPYRRRLPARIGSLSHCLTCGKELIVAPE